LDNNWELLKRGVEGVPTWQEWYAVAIMWGVLHRILNVWIGLQRRPKEARLLVLTLP
jgi:hypothetical protein